MVFLPDMQDVCAAGDGSQVTVSEARVWGVHLALSHVQPSQGDEDRDGPAMGMAHAAAAQWQHALHSTGQGWLTVSVALPTGNWAGSWSQVRTLVWWY